MKTKTFLLIVVAAVATLSFTFASNSDEVKTVDLETVASPNLNQEPVGGFYADVVR